MRIPGLRAAWAALSLCALPWSWPLYHYFYPRLHPDAAYMHLFTRFGLWTLFVAVGGTALAGQEFWRTRSPWVGVGLGSAFAYLAWFPWHVLPVMLRL